MKTKKFQLSYHSTAVYSNELRMQAEVRTDHAMHYCSWQIEHKDDTNWNARIWPDQGRAYTPEQEQACKDLFEYVYPAVNAAIDAYLLRHNFPKRKELPAQTFINMTLDGGHQVKTFRIEYR